MSCLSSCTCWRRACSATRSSTPASPNRCLAIAGGTTPRRRTCWSPALATPAIPIRWSWIYRPGPWQPTLTYAAGCLLLAVASASKALMRLGRSCWTAAGRRLGSMAAGSQVQSLPSKHCAAVFPIGCVVTDQVTASRDQIPVRNGCKAPKKWSVSSLCRRGRCPFAAESSRQEREPPSA